MQTNGKMRSSVRSRTRARNRLKERQRIGRDNLNLLAFVIIYDNIVAESEVRFCDGQGIAGIKA